MKSRIIRLCLLVIVALLMLPLGATFAQDGGPIPLPEAPAPASALDSAVLNAIRAEGRAQVYVALRTDPMALAAAQDVVASAAPAADLAVTRRFAVANGLIAEVSLAGFEALKAHRAVSAVVLVPQAHLFNLEAGDLVGAHQVWEQLDITGDGVRVGVIDSGVDVTHPDLTDSIIGARCFVDNASGCPNGEHHSAFDADGHGTHVAGTITSNGQTPIYGEPGLAPNAGVYAVKVFGNDGGGSGANIMAALDYIAANKATLKLDVINMSLGFSAFNYANDCDAADPFFTEMKNLIGRTGAIVVVAAGNSGDKGKISVPACFSNVIAVGAVYSANHGALGWSNCQDQTTQTDLVTCFSQSSNSLDVLAPGAMVTSTVPGGAYDDYGGTSMASPATAAVVALMKAAKPSLTFNEALTILKQTGKPVTDPRNNRTTPRIDALAAVKALGGTNPGPGGEEIIAQGSFEDQLRGWRLINKTRDGVICNRPGRQVAYAGSCAFQFVGGNGEKSRLQQTNVPGNIAFQDGDALALSFYFNGAWQGRNNGVKVFLIVKYSDGTPTDRFTGGLPINAGYAQFGGLAPLSSPNVASVQLQFRNSNTKGRVLIDAVSLKRTAGEGLTTAAGIFAGEAVSSPTQDAGLRR